MDIPRTPPDLVIRPRNIFFARGQKATRWWKDGDPVATAFYNSLSLVFPAGEAFFIDSVKHFRDQVSETQAASIDDFIRQEAVHSREHSHLNRQVVDAGYDVSSFEADMAAGHAQAQKNLPVINLAVTVALEHFTAVIAHTVLKDDRHFEGVSTESARLWKWHALEEIEHKAVAYDTFLAATKSLSSFKRWKFRCLVMLGVTSQFVPERFRFMGRLFKQDRINTPKTWFKACWYLLGYPGLLRQIIPGWLAFFKPNFHPWQIDDRELISRHEARLALATPLQGSVLA
jgi:predicted metal-dependent hydrolase